LISKLVSVRATKDTGLLRCVYLPAFAGKNILLGELVIEEDI